MTHAAVTAGEILGGFGLLVVGGEFLVRGAAALAATARISPLVIGLTVVAFGTSAPELGVSVASAYSGVPDLAVGNVVGSNICNVLLILGLSALICPLTVRSQLVRLDVPLMIATTAALWWFSSDGVLSRGEGAILFLGLVAYLVYSIRTSRKETSAIAAEFVEEVPPPATGLRGILVQICFVCGGLAFLVLGARWLVDGSVTVAKSLGVSELVIGLTIVAVGTSLPELVTSVIASIRRQRDIAVGNVVGSNIFNIASVLGLSALVAPQGIAVSADALAFDIPVAMLVAVACLPIFFSWGIITRLEGGLLLAYFGIYLSLLVLAEVDPVWHSWMAMAVIWGAIPLTILFLGISVAATLGGRAQTHQETPDH